MGFSAPFMLLGLLALPALAVVYWLRSRSRKKVVSSLALWTELRDQKEGGRIWERLQTPLSLLLELLILLLLTLAAAGWYRNTTDAVRPLVVVLDDSYSMLTQPPADAGETPRERGRRIVLAELARNRYFTRLVTAGPRPRLLGEAAADSKQIAAALDQWQCRSGSADLPAAIAFAGEVGGPAARVLVITDHPFSRPSRRKRAASNGGPAGPPSPTRRSPSPLARQTETRSECCSK
jgi:hypothetical protein